MTSDEELKIYRALLHKIALLDDLGQRAHLNKVLFNISRWSRAYRVGNGALSEEEQGQIVESAIRKLLSN